VIKERLFSIADYFDVLDEDGTKLYRIGRKAFSPRDKVVIEDPNGDEFASVHAVRVRWPRYG
jgi:uncharacterized protein YxjI